MARRLDEQPSAVELREELVPAPAGSDSGLTPAGRRMLEAIGNLPEGEREAFDLMCGKDHTFSIGRDQVAMAFPFGPVEVAATLASALAAHLAMAQDLAAVIAALVMKLFFNPALAAMCAAWKERLEPAAEVDSRSPTMPAAS